MTERFHALVCQTKETYETRGAAERRIQQQNKYGRARNCRPYQCPSCRLWHLTSKEDVSKHRKGARG